MGKEPTKSSNNIPLITKRKKKFITGLSQTKKYITKPLKNAI